MATDKTSTLEERLARFKGISPEQTGDSLLTVIKKTRTASRDANSADSLKNYAQELNSLADKLNFRARNSDSLTEKVQWLKEAKETKLLAQKLNDMSATQSLYERSNRLKGFSSTETTNDLLHHLKEAKSNVRSAPSSKQLDELKTAISKVVNKAIQTNSLQDKSKLIQEAQSAKALLVTKSKEVSGPKQNKSPLSRKEPLPSKVATNPLNSKLHEAIKTADKSRNTALNAVKKYRENKSPINRIKALHALKTARNSKSRVKFLQAQIKKIETINQKTMQFKNTVNMLKSQHQKSSSPSTRKGFRP